ncbi:universal stress protein [Humidisolicoccus flavus]|uniref:universal stress protein n=1 Tax=Humidisolicoccus flavus TaxID=3111414 RepID=UPI0032565752
MRIAVGFTNTPAGRDALALGIRLAESMSASLDLVLVTTAQKVPTLSPPDSGYNAYVRKQAEGWLAEAVAEVPAAISVKTHVVGATSTAAGLNQAANDLGAALIVLGTARGAGKDRFLIGSDANALLHAATLPVVLAPKASRKQDTYGITRVTAAVGERAGAKPLLQSAASLAEAAGVPLRLISLVAIDMPSKASFEERKRAHEHAEVVLEAVTKQLSSKNPVTSEVGKGRSVEKAVAKLEWDDGEIVLVGSSRIASKGKLFIGSTAARMLRQLPVPMMVVPKASALTIASKE